MGSYSMSCGFSGLEIGEQDVAYVCLLGKGLRNASSFTPFGNHGPASTLVRGTYNDYGYLHVEEDEALLALFNQHTGLSLKNGDDFSLEDLNGRPEGRWWIHGAAFDAMPNLTPEFPYARDPDAEGYKSVKIKNIGEATDMHISALRKAALGARAKIEKDRAAFGDDPNLALLVELALTGGKMRDILGYSDKAGLDQEAFYEAIKTGADIEPHLESYRRMFVLEYAMAELRKRMVPSENIGPQHGGHIAMRQFASFLIGVCDAELAEHEGEED